ncbi:MAG: MATE family efflux transporter [Roseovarius sp.]|nr:MATE family efflux transporter [Roseovarius sp.]
MDGRQTYAGHATTLLALGLPLVGSHLAQIAIGVTDNIMLGRYSVEALAAGTLGWSFAFVLFIMGSGFAFAVLPMVASAVATHNRRQVRRATRMGMWISTLYGIAVMPFLIWSKPIFIALGQESKIAELASTYLAILSIGLVASLVVMVLKSYLAALERTQAVFWITVVAAILNGFLNYALIFGNFGAPELGLKGAAAASVIVQFATLFVVVAYCMLVTPKYALFSRLWRLDSEGFRRVFQLGWPIGLTNLAESGLFSATALMMGWVGTLSLAAHGIATQLAAMTFVVHLGLSQAATVRVGQAAGRNDGISLRDGAKVTMAVSAIFALLTIGIYLTAPELLLGLFLDANDPDRSEIMSIGVSLLVVAALFQLVDGGQVIALGLLRGLQDTKVPMMHAVVSYWLVGIPSCYIIGFWIGWGGVGIWLGLVVGLLCASILMSYRFWTHGVSRVPI